MIEKIFCKNSPKNHINFDKTSPKNHNPQQRKNFPQRNEKNSPIVQESRPNWKTAFHD